MRTFLVALCLPAAVCFAQQYPDDSPQTTHMVLGGSGGAVLSTTMAAPVGAAPTFFFRSGGFSFDGKVVTGVPYTADAVTTRTQTLADGNHITTSETAQVARDSEGRTRREQVLPGPPGASTAASQKLVFINDPVAQVNYVLEPNHTARKMPVPRAIASLQAGQSSGQVPTASNAVFFNKAVPPPPTVGSKAENVESLGSQIIESVQADGTRTTTTIPAGQIGNEQPILITYERWYSPDLQTVVMTKQSDPRFGDTTYQLTNIQRAEPPASLFQVPSDYKIAEPGDAVKQIVIQH